MTKDAFDKKLLSELKAAGYSTHTLPDGKISIQQKADSPGSTRKRTAHGFDFTFTAPKNVSVTHFSKGAVENLVMAIRERLSEEDKNTPVQVKMLPNGRIIIDRAPSSELDLTEEEEELLDLLEEKNAHYDRYYCPTPAGASIDEQLRYAVGHGDLQKVETLLEQGAAVNATDAEGKTPLMLAFWTGNHNIEIVKLLLAQGADINIKAQNGDTPLYCGVHNGEDEFIQLLLDAGADAATAADYARQSGLFRIAAWLDQVAAAKS